LSLKPFVFSHKKIDLLSVFASICVPSLLSKRLRSHGQTDWPQSRTKGSFSLKATHQKVTREGRKGDPGVSRGTVAMVFCGLALTDRFCTSRGGPLPRWVLGVPHGLQS